MSHWYVILAFIAFIAAAYEINRNIKNLKSQIDNTWSRLKIIEDEMKNINYATSKSIILSEIRTNELIDELKRRVYKLEGF